jgi:hypothetical protein
VKPLHLASAFVTLLACGDTGQEHVQIPTAARGSERDSISVNGTILRLIRAEVAFGPVYFCATEGADVGLCDVALAELLDTVTIDGLSAADVRIGSLSATTGSVRSALYDYGISWLLTRNNPRASAGAPQGHSAILEGTAESQGSVLRFSAQVDITPLSRGDAAVNARRTSFEITSSSDRLTIALDPYRWLERIDVDELFALDVDGDGAVELGPEHQAYQAIVQGMANRAPAEFVWSKK